MFRIHTQHTLHVRDSLAAAQQLLVELGEQVVRHNVPDEGFDPMRIWADHLPALDESVAEQQIGNEAERYLRVLAELLALSAEPLREVQVETLPLPAWVEALA